MAKKIYLLSIVPLVLGIAACKNNTYNPDSVNKIVERHIPVKASMTVSSKLSLSSTAEFFYINDSTIPFVALEHFDKEFLGNETFENLPYKTEKSGYNLIIYNQVNGSYLDINTVERSATYHNLELFPNTDSSCTRPFAYAIFNSGFLNDNAISYDYYIKNTTYKVDLSKYNIPIYNFNGNTFIPFNAAKALLGNGLTKNMTYANDKMYYYSGSVNDDTLAANEKIRADGIDWITDEYLEDSYNSLALSIDMYFGLDERDSRSNPGTTIKYSHDAYSILAPYKERLFSKEADVSNEAMLEIAETFYDDGGHSMYDSTNILSTKKFERLDYSGDETKTTFAYLDGINDIRKEKKTDIQSQFEGVNSPNGYYMEEDGVAYILFDEFSVLKDSYNAADITEDNYYYDTITLFHYANRQIQLNPDIKDVVIDLSANGGGTIFAEEFISSWICGGTTGVVRNTNTGNMMKYHINADVNFDDVFNSNDYLDPDINVYFMISPGSFSCGNKLPCEVADNREDNLYFIGSQSGGGTCAVTYSPVNFLGGQLRLSSTMQFGRNSSTVDNFVPNESGVTADFYQINPNDFEAYTDLSTIFTKIRNNRNHN